MNNKIGFTFLMAAATVLSALPLNAQERVASTGGRSPHETFSTMIGGRGGSRVTIIYGRPYAKGRKIWGDLVPNGKVWRTGSDEATLLITQKPLVFGDTTVPAGAYTLFTLPAESGATKLIISKQIGQWGLQYDEKQDLARVDMKKETLEKPVEQFTMAIERDSASGGGVLKLSWENTQYSIPFTVQK